MQDVPMDRRHDSTLSMQGLPEQREEDHTIATVENCSFRNNKVLRDIAGVGGNVLEWYDFAVFGYFSDVLGDVFFPPQEGNDAIIESFTVFGLAFLCRPIGGLLLGYIGDVYGRKRALEVSIFLMAFPTFLLGCLPSYSQVGNLAFVMLIIVRMLQGFSVGGQLVSSLVYTCENHPRHEWGFYGSFVMASANFGTLLGGIMATYLRSSLDDDQLHEFGWRIPFLSGVLVSVCGLYLRFFCDEEEIVHGDPSEVPPNPAIASFARDNIRALISASLVPMLWSAGFYIIFVWMTIFMEDLVEPPVPEPFLVTSLALFTSVCILFPIAGSASDLFGRKIMMFVGATFLAVFAPLLVVYISEGSNSIISINSSTNAFIAQFIMGILLSCFGAPMCAWLVESFPPSIRLTSVAVGYNISAIAGGLSPAIATYLVKHYGKHSPGFMITVVASIAIFGVIIAPGPDSMKEGNPPSFDIPEIELPSTPNNNVRHNSVLGVEAEEFEENYGRRGYSIPNTKDMRDNRGDSSLQGNQNQNSNQQTIKLETISGTIPSNDNMSRIVEEDEIELDSHLSYGDNYDGMSFGLSEADDNSFV